MPIVALRQAIVERLKQRFPNVDVDAHPRASFGAEDLSAALKNRNLSLRVAVLGVPEDSEWSSNETDIPVAWAIYLCARDEARQGRRDTIALTILPRLIEAVASSTWRGDGEHKVSKLRASPVYEGESEASVKSALVWAVTWTQILTVSPCTNGDDIRDFLTLITRYDLHEADDVIDASDTISLPRTP